jgi:hypothetical protein
MSQPRAARTRRARRARAHRRREGMALLVIMIIIVITTAGAAISVQNTTAEMHAAGRERVMMHARYAAEAALVSTVSWLDRVGGGPLAETWIAWRTDPPPIVAPYTAGHTIPAVVGGHRHEAARITQTSQAAVSNGVPPVGSPDPGAAIPDLTGSFGPNQPYSMQNFVVDLTDCYEAPAVNAAGTQVNAQNGLVPIRFYCALTVRGRLEINGGGGTGVTWDLPTINGVFQDRTGAAQDARAIIETPTMYLPPQ